MAEKYDHKAVEKKWQQKWAADKTFKTPPPQGKKLYVLDMFPYPSGDGLHVGHVEGYTATDIYSRFKRMQGYQVLHPMGWDAFGLPAENYAIKTGINPKETTEAAINTFRRQIMELGLSYDWEREVGAHQPEDYKWTQWFFLFLYKHGLAEKRMAKVNWCPKDQTVLANEQTVSESGEKGVCVRCGTKVVQKDLEQWFFKITDFADALVDDLDQVDWPESTKINQRNWIGRSEGAELKFEIRNSKSEIRVFTTRPDTLFGATYLVLAPEHPEVANLKSQILNWNEVEAYIEKTKNKTELERQEEQKDKTGAELKGVKALNPATKEEIPVWVADYVLGGYGTGAVMAVPAHDERDHQFAKKFNLEIREIEPADPKKIVEKVGGKWVKTYRLRDWLISRQRYWGAPIPIVYDPQGAPHPVPEEHLPWLLPTDVEFKPTGVSPLGQSKELLERTEKIFGLGWRPEGDTMDTFVCSSWYFFRFADPHNEREFASAEALRQWLPVDLYMGGAEHTVLHLMYARFITHALQKHGVVTFGEPFLKLRHQGTILAEDGSKMSKSKNNIVSPDEYVAQYGADSLRMYEMFMGPLEQQKPWNTKNILGVRRFLDKVWKLHPQGSTLDQGSSRSNLDTLMHQTVEKVTKDLESLKFNTAISALMIARNALEDAGTPKDAYAKFLQLLHPLAPHLTSELAEVHSIDFSQWPVYDPAKLATERVVVAVQVNGKVRVTIELAPDIPEDEALSKAREAAGKWLVGPEKKVHYVSGKVINFVI